MLKKVHYFYPTRPNRIVCGLRTTTPPLDTVEPELVTCLVCKFHLGLHKVDTTRLGIATHITRKQTTWRNE